MDSKGDPPSIVHESSVVIHQVPAEGPEWTEVFIWDYLWCKHNASKISYGQRDGDYPKQTSSSKVVVSIAFGHLCCSCDCSALVPLSNVTV